VPGKERAAVAAAKVVKVQPCTMLDDAPSSFRPPSVSKLFSCVNWITAVCSLLVPPYDLVAATALAGSLLNLLQILIFRNSIFGIRLLCFSGYWI
jgi:hypothetical protein